MVLRSGLWSVHLANKQSARYMEHSIMERSIIHSIIHLKTPILFHIKLPFFDQPSTKMSIVSTPEGRLSFLLPKTSRTNLNFLPCGSFLQSLNSFYLFAVF